MNKKSFLVLTFLFLSSIPSFVSGSNSDNSSQIMDPNAAALVQFSPRNLTLGGTSFSDPAWFNAFDVNGNPLGLLQREVHGFRMIVGQNYSTQSSNFDDKKNSSNNLYAPVFFFNSPGVLGSSIYYRQITDYMEKTDTSLTNPNRNTETSLYTAGLNIAMSLASKYFQSSISVHGIFGNVIDEQGNEKTVGALNKVEFGIGSQPHPLVQLGAKIGASVVIDTLESEGVINGRTFYTWERRGDITLPSLGFFVDFGDTTIHPLLINVGLNYSKSRTNGQHKYAGTPGHENDIWELQYNPRWTNTFELNWNGMYSISKDENTYRPSIRLGMWRKNTERRTQGGGNKYPLRDKDGECIDGLECLADTTLYALDPTALNDVLPLQNTARHGAEGIAHKWNVFGFVFGAGYSQVIQQYATLFTEFEVNTISLSVPADKNLESSDAYTRLLIGAEYNVHSLPAWTADWFKLFLRVGFVTGTENTNFRKFKPYQYQYFTRYSLDAQILTEREFYKPTIGDEIDWTNINFGFGTSMWDSKLETDLVLGFYSMNIKKRDDKFSGFEITYQARINF